MTAGYDLKEGRYDEKYKSAKSFKVMLAEFFCNYSKKESAYKYIMLKSILDTADLARGKMYKISFDLLYARFAEIIWVLSYIYKIPQKATSRSSTKTIAEKIVDEIVEKYHIRKNSKFDKIPVGAYNELVLLMKKQCSRYVLGALYAETSQALYSFSKEREWIKLNPSFAMYIKKHEKSIQTELFASWAEYYASVILSEPDKITYYKRLLKREFGDKSKVAGMLQATRTAQILEPCNNTAEQTKLIKAKSKSNKALEERVHAFLEQNPDLGLYLTQICEKSLGKKEEVKKILESAYWCRNKGNRYYYINVSETEIIEDAILLNTDSPEEESRSDSIDSDTIDKKKLKLLKDPEKLIRYLKKEMIITGEKKAKEEQDPEKIQNYSKAKKPIPQKWDREEVVILVTEYFRTKAMSSEDIADAQSRVSSFLRKRQEMLTGEEVDDVFRNLAGIYMQSNRIRCLDPETKYSGMQGTKLQKEVVQEYLSNPEKIKAEAMEIVKKYKEKCSNSD